MNIHKGVLGSGSRGRRTNTPNPGKKAKSSHPGKPPFPPWSWQVGLNPGCTVRSKAGFVNAHLQFPHPHKGSTS